MLQSNPIRSNSEYGNRLNDKSQTEYTKKKNKKVIQTHDNRSRIAGGRKKKEEHFYTCTNVNYMEKCSSEEQHANQIPERKTKQKPKRFVQHINYARAS